MGDHRGSIANLSPDGTTRDQEETLRNPPRPDIKAPSRRSLAGVMRLFFTLVLLVVVAIVNASTCEVHTSTAVAVRFGDGKRESRRMEKRETSGRDKDLAIQPQDLSTKQVLERVENIFISLPNNRTSKELIDSIGYRLYEASRYLGGLDFSASNQVIFDRIVRKAQQELLDIPVSNDKDPVLFAKKLQIAVLQGDEDMERPNIALCSKSDMKTKSTFEIIPYKNLERFESLFAKCSFALTLTNTGRRNSKTSIIAFPTNWFIRPLPSIGHQIQLYRVVDVAIKPGNSKGSSKDQLLSIFFQLSQSVNTTKGCSYWSKSQANWTTDGCSMDLDVCTCNLSKHLEEDPTGGQYIVYEYSDVFFNKAIYYLILNYEAILPANWVFQQTVALMKDLTFIPKRSGYALAIGNLLHFAISIKDDFIIKNQESFSQLLHDAQQNLQAIPLYIDEDLMLRVNSMQIAVLHVGYEMREPDIVLCSPRGRQSEFEKIPYISLESLESLFKICDAALIITNTGFRNSKFSIIVLPRDRFIRPLPSIGHQIHVSRVVDLAIKPGNRRESSADQQLSIFFQLSQSIKITKGCSYWSKSQANWTTDGCSMDLDVCTCNLSKHLEEDPTGGQYIVYEYADVFFNETSLIELENNFQNLTAEYVFRQTITLMQNLTLLPKGIDSKKLFLKIGQLLFYIVNLEDDFIFENQESFSQLLFDAQQNLQTLQLHNIGELMWHRDNLQISVLRICYEMEEPDIGLCSQRGIQSEFKTIPYTYLSSFEILFKTCDFTLIITQSGLRDSKITIIAFPLNSFLRPLPSIGHQIHTSRVVDIAVKPGNSKGPSEDQLLSILFQPSLSLNITKGCSYWSKSQANWTTDGCVMNLDVCTCNLSKHLEEDPTGGQYIVYEYSDVSFNNTIYETLLNTTRHINVSVSTFSEVSALLHNLSLVPATHDTLRKMTRIVAETLNSYYYIYDYTDIDTIPEYSNFKEIYLDAKQILKYSHQSFNETYNGKLHDFTLFSILNVNPVVPRIISLYLNNTPNEVKAYPPIQNDTLRIIHSEDYTFSLIASWSVSTQNEKFAFMVFPVNRYVFTVIQKYRGFQVHNFRVVDITLVPRVGVSEGKEDQFIDMWYWPSVFVAKDVRLGCMYWNDLNSKWTDEGCQVHVNATSRWCRCSLSAHFDDNREGGKYVVFEYSDVTLSSKKRQSLLGGKRLEDLNVAQKNLFLLEMSAFLQNFTQVGYIDKNAAIISRDLALLALTEGTDALSRNVNLSMAIMKDFRVIIHRWAYEPFALTEVITTQKNYRVNPLMPVALEANNVLSNEAFQAKTSIWHDLLIAFMTLEDQEADIGMTFTLEEVRSWEKTYRDVFEEPQFTFFVSEQTKHKVRLAAIKYPKDKTFLKLSESLPAIFTYQVLDVAIVWVKNVVDLYATDRQITLVHIPEGPERSSATTVCAMWTGTDWSTKSCWKELGNKHACSCNLSTLSVGTFLPLIVYEAIEASNFSPKGSLSALDVLYVIFSTVSLVGLSLIALTAVVFPAWRADVGHKILLHLSLALFFYQTLRLFRETHHVYTALNRDLGTAFIAFTTVTHYSRLANYAWVLTMAVLQLRRLLTVVGAVDVPHLLLKVSVLAWGVPLVPLVALLSWDLELHFARPDKLTHLMLYLVPGVAVTFVNGVLFVIILARIFACCGWGKVNDLGRHGISGAKLTGRRMAMAILLFFLFGTPTVFETFNDIWGHSYTLEVLFKVFDPVRGAVVFAFFVLLDKSTFDMWRQKLRSFAARGATDQDMEMK